MNDYIIELPDFSYNKAELFEYQQKYIEWAANIHYRKGGIDTSLLGFFDHYPTTDCNGLLLEVFKEINLPLEIGDVKFSKLLPDGKMPFHIDPQRSAVFMLPLTDDPAKIEWRDTLGNVLYEHTYKCPTIINAQILHGVPYSHNERIFLQVRINHEWHVIQSKYQSMFS